MKRICYCSNMWIITVRLLEIAFLFVAKTRKFGVVVCWGTPFLCLREGNSAWWYVDDKQINNLVQWQRQGCWPNKNLSLCQHKTITIINYHVPLPSDHRTSPHLIHLLAHPWFGCRYSIQMTGAQRVGKGPWSALILPQTSRLTWR